MCARHPVVVCSKKITRQSRLFYVAYSFRNCGAHHNDGALQDEKVGDGEEDEETNTPESSWKGRVRWLP